MRDLAPPVPELHVAQPPRGVRELPSTPRRSLLAGVSQIVASQALLAAAGFASLPVLAQRLGPSGYGQFSLFVTVLGVVAYQDFARQLIVHEQAKQRASALDLDALTRLSTTGIVMLALAVGSWLLAPINAAALVAATFLHGCTSRDFASLSVAGRVGAATAVRNVAWAFAFVAVAALSFVSTHPLAYSAPFVVANFSVWLACRRLTGKRATRTDADEGAWVARITGYARLRRSPSFDYYRRETLNLLGFTIAVSVLACADRVLLERLVGADELGLYAAQADLALRFNIFGSALSSALFPMLASTLHEHGHERAARKFVRIASAALVGFFVFACVLLAFQREIVSTLLGAQYVAAPPIFGWMLVAVLVQTFGFLLTPWLRAQGDFATPRRAYNTAVVAMLGVGVVLVPKYGAIGALAAVLVSRIAEVQLFIREARRASSTVLPRWKVVAAVGFVLVFTAAASWRLAGS